MYQTNGINGKWFARLPKFYIDREFVWGRYKGSHRPIYVIVPSIYTVLTVHSRKTVTVSVIERKKDYLGRPLNIKIGHYL